MRFNSELMGVVLFDSIVFLRAKSGDKKINCLQRIVDQIYHVTGVAVSAVALGGASFSGQVTYEEMLKYVVEHSGEVTYKFVFVISMGNDIYVKGPDFAKIPYEVADRAESGIRDFLRVARNHFDVIGLVFGGRSDVWQYSGMKGVVYDSLLDEVLTKIGARWDVWQYSGIRGKVYDCFFDDMSTKTKHERIQYGLDYVSSGAGELRTLSKYDIVDRVGHLHVNAYHKLETCVVSWMRELFQQCRLLSRL